MVRIGTASSPASMTDAAFDKLAAADVDILAHPELLAVLDHLETHRRRQPAVEHRLIARLAARGLPERVGRQEPGRGAVGPAAHSRDRTRRRIADAEDLAPRRAMTGEQLQPGLAATAAGQASGQIGPEHIRIIRTFFEQLPPGRTLKPASKPRPPWPASRPDSVPTNCVRPPTG